MSTDLSARGPESANATICAMSPVMVAVLTSVAGKIIFRRQVGNAHLPAADPNNCFSVCSVYERLAPTFPPTCRLLRVLRPSTGRQIKVGVGDVMLYITSTTAGGIGRLQTPVPAGRTVCCTAEQRALSPLTVGDRCKAGAVPPGLSPGRPKPFDSGQRRPPGARAYGR
jgi:hypothetical protein